MGPAAASSRNVYATDKLAHRTRVTHAAALTHDEKELREDGAEAQDAANRTPE